MITRVLSAVLALVSLVAADITLTAPAAGSFANTALPITWTGADKIAAMDLMAGGATEATSYVVSSVPATQYATSSSIGAATIGTAGPSDPSAYYLRLTTTTGQKVFSTRFSLTGMSGAWGSPAAQQGYTAGHAAAPANVAGNNAAAAGGGAAGAPAATGNVPAWSLQTGLTKFAPMQMKPRTAITQTNTAPLYPPSAWSVATTNLPLPRQTLTVTANFVDSVSSRENTASPAAAPSNDMQKFLNRWKD